MKDWTTHFELDAYGERVEVFVPMETVEEHQYSGEQAAKRRARKRRPGRQLTGVTSKHCQSGSNGATSRDTAKVCIRFTTNF